MIDPLHMKASWIGWTAILVAALQMQAEENTFLNAVLYTVLAVKSELIRTLVEHQAIIACLSDPTFFEFCCAWERPKHAGAAQDRDPTPAAGDCLCSKP